LSKVQKKCEKKITQNFLSTTHKILKPISDDFLRQNLFLGCKIFLTQNVFKMHVNISSFKPTTLVCKSKNIFFFCGAGELHQAWYIAPKFRASLEV